MHTETVNKFLVLMYLLLISNKNKIIFILLKLAKNKNTVKL